MHLPVTALKRRSSTPRSASKQHVPLSTVDPDRTEALRSTWRVTDFAGKSPTKPITFDSAL
jgi:hypothetical protein